MRRAGQSDFATHFSAQAAGNILKMVMKMMEFTVCVWMDLATEPSRRYVISRQEFCWRVDVVDRI